MQPFDNSNHSCTCSPSLFTVRLFSISAALSDQPGDNYIKDSMLMTRLLERTVSKF